MKTQSQYPGLAIKEAVKDKRLVSIYNRFIGKKNRHGSASAAVNLTNLNQTYEKNPIRNQR